MPEISIILPTYNGSEYIHESIDSILQQTYTDWELIIVDDCSIDSTTEIVERYVKKDARIRYIRNNSNLKLPATLNVGFSYALGKYLTWTSDDNRYYPNALLAMYGYLEKNPDIPMVCAKMDIFDERTGECKSSFDYDPITIIFTNCVGACFLYRNKVIQKVGEYNTDFFCVEDYEYWLRILRNNDSIAYIEEPLYWYRFHEKSLTVTKQKYIRKQLSKLYDEYMPWMLEQTGEDAGLIMQLYGKLVALGDEILPETKERIAVKLPLIKMDHIIVDNEVYYLFGAGVYGKKAKTILEGKCLFFVDNDINKIGTSIEGVSVISFEDFIIRLKNDHNAQVIVCAEYDKQYGMIEELVDSGIRSFSIVQHLLYLDSNLKQDVNR